MPGWPRSIHGVVLRRRIRERKKRVPWHTYVNSALEVAMPTITMWILCHYGSPVSALTGSISYAYFLLIILSPLRLDPWLCIFTGALAVAGYGALVGAYWPELARAWVGPAALMHLSFFHRGILLAAGGLAAGFVSLRIRATVIATLREVQERERVVDLFGQHVFAERREPDSLAAHGPDAGVARSLRNGPRYS